MNRWKGNMKAKIETLKKENRILKGRITRLEKYLGTISKSKKIEKVPIYYHIGKGNYIFLSEKKECRR